ncbi:hypothetical protein DFH11DRAFT_1600094, partial [Phellopilus nigrolimitatus]
MTRPLSLLCLLGCLCLPLDLPWPMLPPGGSDVFLTNVTDVVATMFCAHAPTRMIMDLLEAKPQVIVNVARTTIVVNVETTARPAVIAATDDRNLGKRRGQNAL